MCTHSHRSRQARENRVPQGRLSGDVQISSFGLPDFTEFLVRAGIDSVSINSDAAVFTRKLVASIEQRIMLKALGQVKIDPDWDLPDPN